uniref:Uncharacterized protein n=1 Tax=Callorhinchus milii TaxID=7868 RepID=A0A4W3HX44_CALMI
MADVVTDGSERLLCAGGAALGWWGGVGCAVCACAAMLTLSLSRCKGFYLISPSEFERFSLSARNVTEPLCVVMWEGPRDHLSPAPALSSNPVTTPKRNQVNGTHKVQSKEEICSLGEVEGALEDVLSTPAQTPLDSPNSSADITLDTTGDITLEDVKDHLPEC